MRDYAAVYGSTNDEYAALCTMRNCSRDYATVCGIAVETMRQYADRVVTYTRHPAVFAVCFQRDEVLLPATKIRQTKQYYIL